MPAAGEQAGEPNAGSLARTDVPTCRSDEPAADVLQRIDGSGWDSCVVVNDARVVLGSLTRARLQGDADATAGDVMTEGPLTTRLDTSRDGVRERLDSGEAGYLLVTGNLGTLAGAIRQQDLDHSG